MAIAGVSVHHDTPSITPAEYSQPHNSQNLTSATQNKCHQVGHLVLQAYQFWLSLPLVNSDRRLLEPQASEHQLARLFEDGIRLQLFYSALIHSIP